MDATNFNVTLSELRSAASDIAKANSDFREAATKLESASNEFSSMWTGPSSELFREKMEERRVWYTQMAEIVDSYVSTINQIATEYEEMDAAGAALIKNG